MRKSNYVFGAAMAAAALSGVDSFVKQAKAAPATAAAFTFENVNGTYFPSSTSFATVTSSSAGNTKYTVTTGTNTNFGSSVTSNLGPIVADSGTGSFYGVHAATNTTWSTPSGNGSAHAVSSNVWTVGDYYQFNVSTAAVQGISVSFDQVGSASGPAVFAFEYSTDGGTAPGDFVTAGTYTMSFVSASSFFASGTSQAVFAHSFALSGDTSLDSNTNVIFRIVQAGTAAFSSAAIGTGGSNRIENFVVSGDDGTGTPEPASLALVAGAGMALLGRRRK